MKLLQRVGTVKVKLDGKGRDGKRTSKSFVVADTNVDELVEVLKEAVKRVESGTPR